MKKCSNCGRNNPEDSLFCEYCGVMIDGNHANENNKTESCETSETADHNCRDGIVSGVIHEDLSNKSKYNSNSVGESYVGDKSSTKWKVAFGIMIVVALISMAVLGLSCYDLWETNLGLEDKYNKLSQDYSDELTLNTKYIKEIKGYKSSINDYKKQIKEISSGIYDEIYTFDPGNYYKDFHSSTDILVVKKGNKKQLDIYMDISNANVNWEWTSGLVCDSDYGEWNLNSTLPVYIVGKEKGTTVFTFSNSKNSETFKVLVVVVD